MYDIIPFNYHLLILDGHSSHVTLEVIKLAMSKGIDMLTFPSHTSYAFQPLDISCFKSFKLSFRAYRDKWTLSHKCENPLKEDLAQWVSHALRRSLTFPNIIVGFRTSSIYPFNPTVIESKMGPNVAYTSIP